MESLPSELRSAREAKRLTLADISEATAINVRFLEAIEQGNMSILPAPYVRAFIREYAQVVGLDPEEVLRRYDQGPEFAETQAAPKRALEAEHVPDSPSLPPTQPEVKPLSARIGRYAILVIVLAALSLGIWNLWRSPGPQPELPVSNGTHDSTSTLPAASPDTTVQPQPSAAEPVRDSLTLSGTAKDSVWVLVQMDNRPPGDFLLKAGQKISWRARDKFLITVGNAGAMEFMLNDKRLGTLGKRGTVVRNVELSRQLLAKH